MTIRFACNNSSCGKTIAVSDEGAGKKCRCLFCRQVQMVPLPAEDVAPATAVPNGDPMRSRGIRHREGGIAVGRIFGEVSRPGVPPADANARAPSAAATPATPRSPTEAAKPTQAKNHPRQAEFTPSTDEDLYTVAEVEDNPPVESFGDRPATIAPKENGHAAQAVPKKMWADKRLMLACTVMLVGIVVGVWAWASAGTSAAAPQGASVDTSPRGGSSKAVVGSPSKAAICSLSKAATAVAAAPKIAKRYPYLSDELNCPDLICGGQTRAAAVPLTMNVILKGRKVATWDYVARKGRMLVVVTSESK